MQGLVVRTVNTSEEELSISDLSPATGYIFTVSATNEIGTSAPSDPLELRTLNDDGMISCSYSYLNSCAFIVPIFPGTSSARMVAALAVGITALLAVTVVAIVAVGIGIYLVR